VKCIQIDIHYLLLLESLLINSLKLYNFILQMVLTVKPKLEKSNFFSNLYSGDSLGIFNCFLVLEYYFLGLVFLLWTCTDYGKQIVDAPNQFSKKRNCWSSRTTGKGKWCRIYGSVPTKQTICVCEICRSTLIINPLFCVYLCQWISC